MKSMIAILGEPFLLNIIKWYFTFINLLLDDEHIKMWNIILILFGFTLKAQLFLCTSLGSRD